MKKVLKYWDSNSVRLKCEINIENLYNKMPAEKKRFKLNWCRFLASDPNNKEIYNLKGNRLIYDSEQLIPTETDQRPSLLLVLGNPASQSIKNDMFFSFEGNGNEHRFWKSILKRSGILSFKYDASLPYENLNEIRKRQLLNLDYDSPYRIGLCVFITLPSAPKGPWGGVAGVKKLLGVKALRKLEAEELSRVLKLAKGFVGSKGAIIAFQKNAWENLRSGKDPEYRIEDAREAKLRGSLINSTSIPLLAVPPTRLAGPCRMALLSGLSQLKYL